MGTILYPFKVMWRIYFGLVFCTTFILLYPLFFVLLSKEDWYGHAFKFKRLVSLVTITLTGVKVEVDKRYELDPNVPMVICPNHQSPLDIILIYCLFPHYFVFMGKHQLRKVPLFGIFFRDMDIPVDRNSRMASHRAVRRAVEDLEKGRPVVMFPEGTISQQAPELRPFKNGPFKLAIETQVPILPVTFVNNHELLPYMGQTGHYGGPGLVHVIIHEPVATNGMTDENLVPLRKQIFNTINDTLHEYKTTHVKSYNTQEDDHGRVPSDR